ncbi:hypothetical protein BC939DRAFT_505344 [Gamsiella multidivaricata]|uniref:uncharacterized protein n=1 Tax=Gamsiella multidivaricata TaxID=101098 RepID=UPI00221F20E2|nr:uncharacterized protein BC939DRAFT_505344 [Gamsiella multidivaricata]KAG0368618.1 hypothetical protein BGZ54_001535 [Gamsiella multidivaricata]KAI7819891.1 hypothetical protein BC939DRAFT_505344 [Gamsiella multidivaricata]
MSTADDDRKQRFRFHKDDEILLLQIVLNAKPCPYKISSRDGAIMVAWNAVAEEFKSKCNPRPDGKLPHPRTCRTRCDKMIVDYLAMRASPHLRHQKQESKEDRQKNELLGKLATLQGRVIDTDLGTSGTTGAGIGGIGGGDASLNSMGPGSGSGPSLVTPGHLLAHGSSSSSTGATSGLNDSQQLHHHTHHQQHRGSAAATLTPQSLANLGNSNHHRMGHGQSTSELLAASGILLPTSTPGVSAIHNSNEDHHYNHHHQDSSSPADIFSVDRSKQTLAPSSSVNSRKRRGNANTGATTAATMATTSSSSSHNGLNSFDYLQRPTTSVSTTQNQPSTMLSNGSKRLKSSALGGKSTASAGSAVPATTYGLHNTTHHSNQARSVLGAIGSGLGSSLTGQDLTGLSSMGATEESDDDDDDDDNDGGFQDAQEDLGNDYEHDFDEDEEEEEDDGQDEHLDASSLLSFQNSAIASKTNSRNGRGGKRGPTVGTVNASTTSSGVKAQANKYGKSSNQGLQRHPSGGLGTSMLSLGGILGGGTGYMIPSQMNADDRSFLMRTLALEERRVKVEVDKIAVEREKLALERKRLQWEMRQMNQ